MNRQEIIQHKKRFGQYFSGEKVADMLYSLLPENKKWEMVIDPMAGIGDMLISIRENTLTCPQLFGIEIDEEIAKECANRVPEATIICRDAFKSDEIITAHGFDLVITNPPYVRYQLQNSDDNIMPSSHDIRENLIHQITNNPILSTKEKNFFLFLANNYSGLADMAVPSWLLCAALVKKGGYLAIVVPETWLNRDYASPIHYMLLKMFRVETIARDTKANWFPDILVKTCLVVAKRVDIQAPIEAKKSLTKIIENDCEFMQPTITLFPHISEIKKNRKWFSSNDEHFFSDTPNIPYELLEIMGENVNAEFNYLSDIMIECGQGLRTGANEFFYVEIENYEGESVCVRSKSWDCGGKKYLFNKDDIIPTLKNRGEINGLVVTPEQLSIGVIYPQGEIQGDLASYISSAEKYRDAKGRRFKEFSAVRPNEKRNGNVVVREWFRLPKMVSRHLPKLCITRVSAKIPECLYIPQSEEAPIAIDANMVTLWGNNAKNIRIAMAILNSTWSKLLLELICTVMGGGALKIESTHLKKLLIPKMSDIQLKKLEAIGTELILKGVMTDSIQNKIDKIIASVLGDTTITHRMRNLLMKKYKERSIRL